MRKETPINTQLPEWKKEVAEKVKAYGERKKRLTTPPHPLRQNNDNHTQIEQIPVKPAVPYLRPAPSAELTRAEAVSQPQAKPPETKPLENKSSFFSSAETAPSQPAVEVWTQDVQGLVDLEALAQGDDSNAVPGPYLMRRVLASVIDNAMLIIVTAALLFGFSFFMNTPVEWLIFSSWKGTLLLFLLIHFLYYLYFLRASRQTPGMLFVSLEVRDPSIHSVPIGKIIVRWFAMVLLNVVNMLPAIQGKHFLLLDQLSGTEVRSFK